MSPKSHHISLASCSDTAQCISVKNQFQSLQNASTTGLVKQRSLCWWLKKGIWRTLEILQSMLLCTKSICGSFTVINLVSYRSVCLDSVQTSMETGTTTGRRTIWPELSDTQESTMEITNIMSPCCWQTSTKSECLKADDTEPICAAGWPPNEPQQPFNVRYPPKEEFCFHFISLFYRFQRHFHYSAQPSFLSFTEVAV